MKTAEQFTLLSLHDKLDAIYSLLQSKVEVINEPNVTPVLPLDPPTPKEMSIGEFNRMLMEEARITTNDNLQRLPDSKLKQYVSEDDVTAVEAEASSVVNAYENGVSVTKIMDDHNISTTKLYRILDDFGVERRGQNGSGGR